MIDAIDAGEHTLRRRRQLRDSVRAAGLYLCLGLLLFVLLFPVYWLLLSSLKHQSDFFTSPPVFLTTQLTTEHYQAVLADPFNRRYLLNTAIVAVVSTLLATLVGTAAAYILARIRLPIRLNRVLLVWILVNRLFPPISFAIPYYLLIRELGLIDTLAALILSNTAAAIPFVVWTMLGYFQDLPKEVERAAMIDGCTLWQRFVRVVMPMSTTSMVITAIFVFIYAWNELLYALTLTVLKARTVPVAIAGYVGDNALAWGQMSAFGVISFVPVMIAVLAVQRHIVRGLTFGAVKS
ncbi:carbohydrate ABC transporter permease [Peristeroidobacter soli]|jgi:multiple sugar transport system permease protein|uniref:carbohydrate ABC transporter permease n=1 Tax=Peristeroidobacter soli TaxID=2497877 RepID=UPI00101DE2F0|nr:carbohydrate ABC transporter permease [Peristeroidobacter soli]